MCLWIIYQLAKSTALVSWVVLLHRSVKGSTNIFFCLDSRFGPICFLLITGHFVARHLFQQLRNLLVGNPVFPPFFPWIFMNVPKCHAFMPSLLHSLALVVSLDRQFLSCIFGPLWVFLPGFDFSLRFLFQPGLTSSFRLFLFRNTPYGRHLIGKFLERFPCLCLNVYLIPARDPLKYKNTVASALSGPFVL